MKKATKQKQSSRQNGERDQLIVKFVKQWSEFPEYSDLHVIAV